MDLQFSPDSQPAKLYSCIIDKTWPFIECLQLPLRRQEKGWPTPKIPRQGPGLSGTHTPQLTDKADAQSDLLSMACINLLFAGASAYH